MYKNKMIFFLGKMRDLLVEAGKYKPEDLTKLEAYCSIYTKDEEFYLLMDNAYTAWLEVYKIYTLPGAQWKHYELFGITNLREQKMLKKALVPLKENIDKALNYANQAN